MPEAESNMAPLPPSPGDPALRGHVLVPLALYHRMAQCFYAGGRRFMEPEPPTPSPFPVSADRSEPPVGGGVFATALSREGMGAMIDRLPREVIPRGVAARRKESVNGRSDPATN